MSEPTLATIAIHPALRQVERGPDGYMGRFHDLAFIVSVALEDDGKRWLHASVSRRDKTMPLYEDVQALKHYCIGDDKAAYQVFPAEENYVHSPPLPGRTSKVQVLHLWHCMDGDPLPEFSGITAYGRSI